MAAVRVLGGGLRQLLGARSLEIRAERVDQVLAALAARGGPPLARRLYADPEAAAPVAHRDLRVLVNGRNHRFLGGLAAPLRETDTVTIHLAGARAYPGG